ncbi:MAG: EF-hand domain-containing protein [Sphingomonas sp.]|uniref:EF-hand domain-containing protein n=1 Tax=Sphingomonas sp. TaxID=28214 RepID=UPI0025FA2EF5|nr:EF-hand domain-containing protein [Sphingomonas sp.]MBX3563383.1 EF-hand domain-containing protein [Sphingomonas sp.]
MAIAGAAIGSASAQDAKLHERLFVSPMGEPFRSGRDGPAPQDVWFDGADTNHDGALTLEEMIADGARFFAILDVRGDGEIDPDDMERYETVLLPEVRGGGPDLSKRRTYLKGDGSGLHDDNGAGSPRDRTVTTAGKKGAARFGYLDYPQPVIVADRNFNRGVDPREWAKAAELRFNALDTNGDGKILKSELPDLPQGRGW